MDRAEIISKQIERFHSVILNERDNRVKVRNWSVTIWIAYLTILGSGKFEIPLIPSLLLLIMIVTSFWIMEGFHQSLVLVNEGRVKKLEELLADEKFNEKIPVDFFYTTGYRTIKKEQKIRGFLLACFTAEPIVFFHSAMLIGGIFFILFFNSYVNKQTVLKPTSTRVIINDSLQRLILDTTAPKKNNIFPTALKK